MDIRAMQGKKVQDFKEPTCKVYDCGIRNETGQEALRALFLTNPIVYNSPTRSSNQANSLDIYATT